MDSLRLVHLATDFCMSEDIPLWVDTVIHYDDNVGSLASEFAGKLDMHHKYY